MINTVKFNDIVKSQIKPCDKCFQIIYHIPINIDKDLPHFLSSFGKPLFDLDVLNLLEIETKDEYKIKGRIENNYLYFSLPLNLKSHNIENTRKREFEKCLCNWIESKLPISILH